MRRVIAQSPASRVRAAGVLLRSSAGALAALLLAFAGTNFFLGIGSSSLFVDESFSWNIAAPPLRDLYSQVKLTEVAPPGYYAGLHAWLHLGSSISEAWMRTPSAVAGICLVAATGWLAHLVAGRTAALCAALLTLASPLVLTYAQQIRAYIFVMLATTLAVGLAVRAMQGNGHRISWLAASATAGVAAIWLHYTCLPVIAGLIVWVVTRPTVTTRAKLIYATVLVFAQALVTPLLSQQASTGNPGTERFAHLTPTNAIDVLGNPLDGRFPATRRRSSSPRSPAAWPSSRFATRSRTKILCYSSPPARCFP